MLRVGIGILSDMFVIPNPAGAKTIALVVCKGVVIRNDILFTATNALLKLFKPAELKSSDESWLSQLKDKDEEIESLIRSADMAVKTASTSIVIAIVADIALVVSWAYFIAHYLIYKH